MSTVQVQRYMTQSYSDPGPVNSILLRESESDPAKALQFSPMHPSLRVLNQARAHQPLIRFIGKRVWDKSPTEPHAHPAAPSTIKERFADFLKAQEVSSASAEAGSSSSGEKAVFTNFWEAPERYWKQNLEDWEIDAVMSGGASIKH